MIIKEKVANIKSLEAEREILIVELAANQECSKMHERLQVYFSPFFNALVLIQKS